MNQSSENHLSLLIKKALDHHVAGRIDQAEILYQQVLKVDPTHPIALNQLGTVALQKGNFNAAVGLIALATKHKPDYAEAHNNLASTLLKLGRTEDALKSYRKAIEIKPDYINAYNNLADTLICQGQPDEAVLLLKRALAINCNYHQGHNNLGNALMKLGVPDQAITSYHKAIAIKPDYFEAHNNLGNALVELGLPNDAIASYLKALGIKPDYTEALLNIGAALVKIGELDEAISSFQKVLNSQPDHAEALFSLGIAFAEKDELEEAINYYTKAIRNKPKYPAALNNMGNALLKLQRPDEAVTVLKRALEMKPSYVEAHNNLGNALKEQNRPEEAIASYCRAICLKPDFAESHCNLGVLFKEIGKLNKAMICFSKALQARPDYAEAEYNLGLAFLLKGNFEKGWKGYASRWKCHPFKKSRRPYDVPFWEGQNIKNKTLFIYPEQGLGDFIQFVRYIPIISKLGGHIITEVPQSLYELISNTFCNFQIIGPEEIPCHFDLQSTVLELPIMLGTNKHSIPAPDAYLNPPEKLIQKWSKRLNSYSGFKAGLVWAGDPKHKNDKNRSIDPVLLAPLMKLNNIKIFSLQVGHTGEATRVLGKEIIDLAPELTSFNETAAAMKNLDVIISVDSSPAHLAGALGCCVWTLLPFMPCWRWMLDSDKTPWYPSMRLFRQTTVNDWSVVIDEVSNALRAMSSSNKSV